MRRATPCAVLALALSVTGSGFAQDTGATRAFKFLMGTQVRVEVYGGAPALRQDAIDEAFAAVAGVDQVMSDYREDSELTVVNRNAATRPIRISEPLFAVLDAAARVYDASGGAFDVSIRPLLALAGVKDRRPHEPTRIELEAVRPLIGFRYVALDREHRTVRFSRSGMAIDLTGIAHGFAAELAAASLRRRGLSGVVDTGTPYVVGAPTGKTTTSVGIRVPGVSPQVLGAVDVTDAAVATVAATASGVPRFDPRTLKPVVDTISATVVSPDGTLAESLAHAVLVLGPHDGLALLTRFRHTWGIVVSRTVGDSPVIDVTPAERRRFHPARQL